MRKTLVGVTAFVAGLAAVPTAARAADYHHVHLAATSAEEAAQWYIKHMGCGAMPRKDACLIGTTQLVFANREPKGGSQGTGIDHIGFSFSDLTTRMKELESAGVKVVTPVRDAPGLFKLAFVEDPWGLRSVDPDGTVKWYKDVFGGENRKKGIQFQQEPRPFKNALGQNMKISFLVGPDGVRIEVVQPKA